VARYLIGRLAAVVVTVWLIGTLGFILIQLIPGDPARQLAGPTASIETVVRIRHAYGFDRPAVTQYVDQVARFVRGDLGYSFSRGEPVRSVIARGLTVTLPITPLAFLGELVIAIPLAVFVVSRRGRLADRALVALAGATTAVPSFLFGLLLLYLFAFRLRWFPLGGSGSGASLVLPVACVAVPFGLVLARLLRTTLLEEQEQAYVQFALSQGQSLQRVRWRHALPNAILPLLSVLALDVAGLFSAVAVVEVVFSIQGLGTDLFGAIRRVDTPLIVVIALVAGLVVALVNLAADLAVIAIDPRVRGSHIGTASR